MRKLFILICLQVFSHLCYSQEDRQQPKPKDSTIFSISYAIMRVNWNSRNIYTHYEDGKIEQSKAIFSQLSPTADEEIAILMERFIHLNKEGYLLVDSAHGGCCHRPPAPISNSNELSNVFNATRNINPKSASSSIKNQAFR